MGDFSLFNSTNPNGGLPIDVTRSQRDNTVADPLATGTSTSAPAGPPISPGLKRLCVNFNHELRPMPGKRAALKGESLRASIQRSLDKSHGGANVECESSVQGHSSVCDALEKHRGPVILLAPSGQPEFVFEWKNDAWHGYNAITFACLPPEMSPDKKVKELFIGSHHGMYFSTYRVKDWKESPNELLFVERPEEKVEGTDSASLLHRRSLRSSMGGDDSTNLHGAPPEVSPVNEEDGIYD